MGINFILLSKGDDKIFIPISSTLGAEFRNGIVEGCVVDKMVSIPTGGATFKSDSRIDIDKLYDHTDELFNDYIKLVRKNAVIESTNKKLDAIYAAVVGGDAPSGDAPDYEEERALYEEWDDFNMLISRISQFTRYSTDGWTAHYGTI